MSSDQPIEELIQRSSFGTPKAQSLSDRTPDEVARRIVDRVRDHVERPEADSVPGPQTPEAALKGYLAALSEHATMVEVEAFRAACTAQLRYTSMLVQLFQESELRTAGQLLDSVRLAAAHAAAHTFTRFDKDTALTSLMQETSQWDAVRSTAAAAFVGRIDPDQLSSLARTLHSVGSYARHTPLRRCMLAIDIAGFSRPDHSTRLGLRTALRDLLGQSLSSAGIDWTQMELADFGDGALVLIEPKVSRTRPLHPLVSELARSLARYNHHRHTAARLRLRMAVHSGEVQRTEQGFAGEDLDVAFRLLSSQALRNRLARSRHADLALIVSDRVYERTVAHGEHQTGIAASRPVQVEAGQGTVKAWVCLPADEDLVAP